MADHFIAEIRMFPFDYPPTGWAWCNGQLLSVQQNSALYTVIGNIYGGDGIATFALPNLQGRFPIGQRPGQEHNSINLGKSKGQATTTLLGPDMPPHRHALFATDAPGNGNTPAGAMLAIPSLGRVQVKNYATVPTGQVSMNQQALGPAGGSQPHTNMPPYLTLRFAIALGGTYPARP